MIWWDESWSNGARVTVAAKLFAAVEKFRRRRENLDDYRRIEQHILMFVMKQRLSADYGEVGIRKQSLMFRCPLIYGPLRTFMFGERTSQGPFLS